MDIFKSRTVLKFIVLIFLLAFASYATYFSYQKYNIEKNNTKLSFFIDTLDFTLNKIIDERIDSIEYLTNIGKINFNRLKSSRKKTDYSLEQLNNYVDKNYKDFQYKVKIIFNDIKQAREEVDSLNQNKVSIFTNIYHNRVFSHFTEILSNLSSLEKNKDIKFYIDLYKKYAIYKENNVVEYLGIYYVVLDSKAMNDSDILLWKKLWHKNRLPSTDTLMNNLVNLIPKELQLADNYSSDLYNIRETILSETKNGDYSISILNWKNYINVKLNYFTKVQLSLYNKIKSNEEKNVKLFLAITILFGLILILILYKLFIIIMGEFKENRNNQISTYTLKDIELVFNNKQLTELTRLIEEAKVDHIYKFLIKAIRDANQTKDIFLASMSHEIRTPLNGIVGFTSLLKETSNKEEQKEFISTIEESSANLLSIVNNVLDLSKIKADKIDLESIEFDPVISFEPVVEAYAKIASKKNIDFEVFIDPTLPIPLLGDPTKISQIIDNLVSNAIKFTHRNGKVNISIEKTSQENNNVIVKFEVSDTGIGISKEQRKNIFKAFSKIDISTSRQYGSTGLGLSISGKFVELMGGKMSIWSLKDEGSSFYFNLKFKKAVSAKSREVEDMSSSTIGILGSHIDDEYFINENLERYIAYTGAKIVYYTDELLLSMKGSLELPDMLFIEHKYRHRADEIKQFIDFNTKVIVITTIDRKESLKVYKSYIDRVIYGPVTLTKVLNALSSKKDDLENEKRVTFKNVHVLVAEDNKINQKLIINILNRVGVEVSIANNGKEAFEMRMNGSYDMIFMDIQMPIMGGIEATNNILNYEKNNKKHIPIVALTANAVAGDREKYIGAGMDDYLTKPIELDKLNILLQVYFEDRIVED